MVFGTRFDSLVEAKAGSFFAGVRAASRRQHIRVWNLLSLLRSYVCLFIHSPTVNTLYTAQVGGAVFSVYPEGIPSY